MSTAKTMLVIMSLVWALTLMAMQPTRASDSWRGLTYRPKYPVCIMGGPCGNYLLAEPGGQIRRED